MKNRAIALGLMLIVGACANTDGNLSRETARFLGNMTSDQVTVSNVDRGMTSVTWDAQAPTGAYRCEADDMLRRVNCAARTPTP